MVELHDPGTSKVSFSDVEAISEIILGMFERGEFDVCSVVYNRFKSVIAQIPTVQQVIPFAITKPATANENGQTGPKPVYEFEPERGSHPRRSAAA